MCVYCVRPKDDSRSLERKYGRQAEKSSRKCDTATDANKSQHFPEKVDKKEKG